MTDRTRSQIGRSSRAKGQRGERELAAELSALIGVEIKRRVRNHASDSDLTGLDGWSIESKCCARPELSAWWKQTIEQTKPGELPVLIYKLPRRPFRAVLPLNLVIGGDVQPDLAYTFETSLEGFAAVYREVLSIWSLNAQQSKTMALLSGEKLQ